MAQSSLHSNDVQAIRNKYKKATKDREKQLISKVPPLDFLSRNLEIMTFLILKDRGQADSLKTKKNQTTVKVTIKKSVEGTQEDLIELSHSYVKRFKKHYFNIKQQYAFCRELRNNISEEEASRHVQTVHFGASHHQQTPLIKVCSKPVCFSTICPSRHKSPPAIWHHLNPLKDYFQAQHPQVSVLFKRWTLLVMEKECLVVLGEPQKDS
ncbi:unnamed protein product [Menidia menidia]|uniref:(Atlantic silverside) hypothetical protein n=1 Tax=Menidia menidia TaxID=238744 RepID=A0A8S4A7Z9_9TELE|nr:unnamed protein product [Menidia menidia]